MFSKMQNFLEVHLQPIAQKLNQNDIIRAISAGMMGTMPVTLGVAVLSILLYMPFPAWQTFLTNSGILSVGMMVLTVTSNLLAPYALISVAHAYASIKKTSQINAIITALVTFLILMPLNVIEGQYQNSYTISTGYLGSNGLFIAMFLGLLIPSIYNKLMKHVGIKLPDSVPPMVTESLSPTFAAMIIFFCAFLVKYGFSLTSFGNFFDFFNTVIGAPVMSLGASVPALLLAYTFANLLWFFGIHPAAILNIYAPAMSVAMSANIAAFMAGTAAADLPYLGFQVIYGTLTIGGSGVLIGLSLSMLTAKSERYKSLSKLSIAPALFNISEPIMFGFPVVLNPIFFFPMIISVPLVGGVSALLVKLGLGNAFNPVISSPWIMPAPITGFLQGGFGLMIIMLVAVGLSTALYYPFFKAADAAALKEEKGETAE